jgi:hypothetical protein
MSTARLYQLLDQYLHQRLNDEELHELELALLTNSAARGAFWHLCVAPSMLRRD